ncbi:acetyltransferase [Clostridium vincentii]|uniref:Putative acetyltransferase EpsM n=1 Tax=Clostridium vincentii TaxID=52704 RepID=A0A2T0BG49_9CLOT|nr:acetyltransferase [Clostridium vincentii]PRR82849.1 putative acetyltransferase EpsM [Clostridium vincentii]
MKTILIIGAGGFAREVKWLIDEINKSSSQWEFMGYFDEKWNVEEKKLLGYKVYTNIIELLDYKQKIYVVCAIGDSILRKKVIEELQVYGFKFATIIHPNVLKSDYVTFEEGCIICANNIFTTNIKVGKHVIFNLSCTTGHDVNINDYVTVFPSVSISGGVNIGAASSIGTKSAIIQGKNIGHNVTIGAGAVVITDIPDNCTAVGMPAKPIKFK